MVPASIDDNLADEKSDASRCQLFITRVGLHSILISLKI